MTSWSPELIGLSKHSVSFPGMLCQAFTAAAYLRVFLSSAALKLLFWFEIRWLTWQKNIPFLCLENLFECFLGMFRVIIHLHSDVPTSPFCSIALNVSRELRTSGFVLILLSALAFKRQWGRSTGSCTCPSWQQCRHSVWLIAWYISGHELLLFFSVLLSSQHSDRISRLHHSKESDFRNLAAFVWSFLANSNLGFLSLNVTTGFAACCKLPVFIFMEVSLNHRFHNNTLTTFRRG